MTFIDSFLFNSNLKVFLVITVNSENIKRYLNNINELSKTF